MNMMILITNIAPEQPESQNNKIPTTARGHPGAGRRILLGCWGGLCTQRILRPPTAHGNTHANMRTLTNVICSMYMKVYIPCRLASPFQEDQLKVSYGHTAYRIQPYKKY